MMITPADLETDTSRWSLTLYVNGYTRRSQEAIDVVRKLCDGELSNQVDLEIVDLAKQPTMVMRDNVFAAPTLIRRLPVPLRRLVGNLSDVEKVRSALDLAPTPHAP